MNKDFLATVPNAAKAWKNGQKWVGLMVCDKIRHQMQKIKDFETKTRIEACLQGVAESVEEMCPTLAFMTGDDSVQVINIDRSKQKPALTNDGEIFVIAVSDTAIAGLTFEGPLEYDETIPHGMTPTLIWHGIIKCLSTESDRLKIIPTLIGWRIGKENINGPNEAIENIRKTGMTPCIIVIAVQNLATTAGLISVISLPEFCYNSNNNFG